MNNEQIEKVLEQLTGIVTTLTTEVTQLKESARTEKKEEEKKNDELSHLADEDIIALADYAASNI